MNPDQYNTKEKLEPVNEAFIQSLEHIKNEIVIIKADVEKERLNAIKEVDDAKEERRNQSIVHKTKMDKLDDEIGKYQRLQMELQKELGVTRNAQSEVNKLKVLARNALDSADGERSLARNEREKAEALRKEREISLASLKKDFDLISKKNEDLRTLENKNSIKSKDLYKREELVIQDRRDISMREIDLKEKQKSLELELKRVGIDV